MSVDGTRFLSEGRACPLKKSWLGENPHLTATVTYGKRLDFVWTCSLGGEGRTLPRPRIKAHVALAFPVLTSAKSTALCVVSPVRGR